MFLPRAICPARCTSVSKSADPARWRSYSMNPLGLAAERFTVAADPATGELLGFGQLEPKPTEDEQQFLELRTMIVRAEHR